MPFFSLNPFFLVFNLDFWWISGYRAPRTRILRAFWRSACFRLSLFHLVEDVLKKAMLKVKQTCKQIVQQHFDDFQFEESLKSRTVLPCFLWDISDISLFRYLLSGTAESGATDSWSLEPKTALFLFSFLLRKAIFFIFMLQMKSFLEGSDRWALLGSTGVEDARERGALKGGMPWRFDSDQFYQSTYHYYVILRSQSI